MSEHTKVTEWTGLTIQRLDYGGFVIMERNPVEQNIGHFNPLMYACTSIKEALSYIEKKIGRDR